MQSEVCSLCCAPCDNLSEIIEEDAWESLLPLLPHLDLKTRSVACTNCSTKLRGYLEFKSSFMQAPACVQTFDTEQGGIMLDFKEAYVQNKGVASEVGAREDVVACRFCLKQPTGAYVTLVEDQKELISVRIMIRECFPGLELGATSGHTMCVPCHNALEASYNFIRSLNVKSCIKEEGVVEEMKLEERADLKPRLFKTEAFPNMNDRVNSHAVKEETDSFTSNAYDFDGAVDAKVEGSSEQVDEQELDEKHEVKTEAFQTDGSRNQDLYDKWENDIEIKDEDVEVQEHSLSSFEGVTDDVKVKQLWSESTNSKPSAAPSDPKKLPEVVTYKCDACSYETKTKGTFRRHLLIHKKPSEVTMYKCEMCSYETNFKDCLRNQKVSHKECTIYKCGTCTYETHCKSKHNRHMLVHKKPSEVTMYKCEACSYETKFKYHLRTHMLVHKKPSEITMYKCEECTFQTRHKTSFKHHSLRHKKPSDMYKCKECSYETKSQRYYKQHMVIHKRPSEVTIYKCDVCLYTTIFKNNYNQHMLIHKDPSEVAMYKCKACSFETKHRWSYDRHVLGHKNLSEVTMYKCESCTFETRYKPNLRCHELSHMNSTE